mgnify:CR=1 FL=1
MAEKTKTIGIIGGGQLGLMIVEQAHLLGARTLCLDPAPDAPAFALSDGHIVAAYDDAAQIVSNTLRPTRIYAEKQWNPSAAPVPVTFALEYLAEGGAWTKLAQVTVDGTADTQPQAPYYEYEAWKAVWENLPQAMPGSSLAQGGKTQYRVTETLPGGYLQQASEQATIETGGTEYPLFRYVNVEATRLAVEKVWHGTPQAQQGDVVVGGGTIAAR